jgi:hypothetical protein
MFKNYSLSPFFSRFLLAAVFFSITIFYLSFLPVAYSFDGTVFSHFLRFALVTDNWLQVTQIHHVLYFPLNYLVYRSLQNVFQYRVLEFFHLQLFSMFFGVMTLVLVERMLKKLDWRLTLRLLAVMIVAFSYSFWLYALDAEPHIPGVFFVVAGLYWLVFKETGKHSPVVAALCFVFAGGFHLTNGLMVGTVCFYLIYRRASWRRHARFYLAYIAFTLLVYGGYAAVSHKPVFRIVYNMFFGADIYSGYHTSFVNPLRWSTIVLSFAALKNALVAQAGIWSWLILSGFLALLAMASRRPAAAPERAFQSAMLFWFAPYFLFFTFWSSANIEFKIHALVPLLLIAMTSLSRLKPLAAHTIGAGLACGLLLVNLFSAIRPMADIRQNTNYQVAVAMRKATPAGAQILITGNFHGYGYGKIYIPYFAMREVWILDWLLGKGHALPDVLAWLKKNAASGKAVYALGEIAGSGKAMASLLIFHHVKESDYSRFRSAIRFVLAAELPGNYRLYRLEFPAP